MSAPDQSRTAIYAAIAGNLAVAVTKFIAAGITGSSAMAAEGVHSCVDTGNGTLMLLGLRLSRRPPDQAHPFGHGRELYFWTLIVAVSIFAVGGGLSIYQGVLHLLSPRPLEDPTWNYVVLGCASIFEGISWYFGWRAFRRDAGGQSFWRAIHRSKNPTSFMVMFEDSAALIGLGIAFVGILLGTRLGLPWMDGLSSVLIGLILAAVAAVLGYETHGLLIGEGYDRQTVEHLRSVLLADDAVEHVEKLLTMYFGPQEVMAAIELRLHGCPNADEIRGCLGRLQRKLFSEQPDLTRIYFAAESLTR